MNSGNNWARLQKSIADREERRNRSNWCGWINNQQQHYSLHINEYPKEQITLTPEQVKALDNQRNRIIENS